MMPFRRCLVLLLCLVGLSAGTPASATGGELHADSHVVRLTSLEWPPYTGSKLHEQGIATAVVRAALAAMGYRLEVEFYPWSRAVASISHGSDFIGYFPEYMSPEVARGFLLSDAIGNGPLGFAERVDEPVRWTNIDSLVRHRIGVVQGYVNTEAFDRRVREGRLNVDSALDDEHNLLKLAAGRISLAVIDRRVFDFLMHDDPKLRPVASRLRFNGKLLEDKKLYVCFRRSPEGERARDILNAGLKKIDIAAVMAAALKS